jgi:stalled ribosome rescue protein Dom34
MKIMSDKNKKQFGIWMDSHQAVILGRENLVTGNFVVLANEKNAGDTGNSNENASNNNEKTLRQAYFKEIASHMQNIDELHVTGTGQVQEQFIRYMAETPQFKNVVANHSTMSKMSEERLVEFITAKFN